MRIEKRPHFSCFSIYNTILCLIFWSGKHHMILIVRRASRGRIVDTHTSILVVLPRCKNSVIRISKTGKHYGHIDGLSITFQIPLGSVDDFLIEKLIENGRETVLKALLDL